ncbi:MAG TPA: hypothetical protein VEK35_07155 [Roseiarcus sp.]|nr:hypothetical protein [Roseiarcus sp.]
MRLLTLCLSTMVGLAFAGEAFASADQSNATHHYRLGYRQTHIASADRSTATHGYRLAYWQTHIAQAQGRVSRDLKSSQKPAEASNKAASAVVSVPMSCNSSNAATPYCYTATQQSIYPPEGELFVSAQAARAMTESRSETPTTKTVLGLAVLGALVGAR